MTEIQDRVRERLRARMLETGGAPALEDPALFADVDALLRRAAEVPDASPQLLPEILGEPERWRLQTAMRYRSHRDPGSASLLAFLKQRVLMPPLRWLFEYSRDNFERQRRTNHVLFACVQELAIETVRLRREVDRLASSSEGSQPIERT